MGQTTFRFSDTYPNILFQLIDFYLVLEMDYSLVTTPEIYKDIGRATFNIAPFKISTGLTTTVKDGVLQVELENFNYFFVDYTIDFTGNGDVSFILASIFSSLKPIFQADLSPNIQALLESMVMPQVNTMLQGLGTTMEVAGFVFDYAFMDHPQYSADDFNIVLKGEVRTQNGTIPPFEMDRKVPAALDPSGGFVQVFLSDYVIRSLLYAVWSSEILSLKVREIPGLAELNVGLLKYLIIDLKKKYSDDTPMYIEINDALTPIPDFYIKGGETYVGIQLNIIIGVTPKGGEDTKIASMTAQTNLTLNYGLEGGNKIKASITTFRLDLTDKIINYDPVIKVDSDDFNSTLGLIPGLGRNYVNYALQAFEIAIPEIPLIDVDLNKTYILEKDGYLIFETSPKIDFKLSRTFNGPPPFDSEKSFRKLLSAREAKVELVKKLVQVTPIMSVIEEAKRQKRVNIINPELFGTTYRKVKKDEENCEDKATENKGFFESFTF